MPDVRNEIRFQTTRSGGKGGQNVNKVETAVIGFFNVQESVVLNDEQKKRVLDQLASRLTSAGEVQVRSQVHRTQLANKEEVIEKINSILTQALKKKKARIATRPSRQSREKRLEWKKKNAEVKSGRKKFRPPDF